MGASRSPWLTLACRRTLVCRTGAKPTGVAGSTVRSPPLARHSRHKPFLNVPAHPIDDPSSDTSVRTNDGGGSTLTDASLDSGELPADNENADADASTPLVAEAAQAADAATVRARDVEVKMYKTVGEFERNLPKTVTLLQTPEGSKVYVVGTAHFSRESMDDVSLVSANCNVF